MEETITCGNCGREVPRTLYCIYCGAPLLGLEVEERREIEESRVIEEIERVKMGVVEAEEVRGDVEELMERLRDHYVWRLRLCSILCDGGVSGEVFRRLYEEYSEKIEILQGERERLFSKLREELEERRGRLEEARRRLEELNVRAAVGQIPMVEVEERTPKLRREIEELSGEVSRLEAQLSRLREVMGEMKPRELSMLEETARRCLNTLDRLVREGKMERELGERVRRELKETLRILEGVVGDKRRKEEELRMELSLLEARYKVGEITLSELEERKRRIEEELERLWL
jgi:DNA repair exonuclease SbcCD ATPase subunit